MLQTSGATVLELQIDDFKILERPDSKFISIQENNLFAVT